jgi:hypothetical protein
VFATGESHAPVRRGAASRLAIRARSETLVICDEMLAAE